MDFKYFQFASPFNGSRLITTADDVDIYWDESQGLDTGRSWQCFDESINDYCKYHNGSPSGYQGKSDSPIIPIDIDNSSTTNLVGVLNKLGELKRRLEKVEDDRGFFARYFCAEEYRKNGLDPGIVQINNSYGKEKGTIRGIHFQLSPYSA